MQFILLTWKKLLPAYVLILVLLVPGGRAEARNKFDIFPVYPSIQPNVDFWLKVYTRYSSDQGIIHDKYRMNRIYGVIPLVDPYRGNGRKINNKRIKTAKKEYQAILKKLMQGKPPTGAAEKRVAKLFAPDAKAAVFRSAMRNLRCQTGQKNRFRQGLIRSGAYIDEIKQIFRDAGLPKDLAYLPHVESSFNPKAYSKFGAAGMWQFTRSTGKQFMKVGYTIDERRDPILSSVAAVKLLGRNYRKLNTWPMAITAYNHGLTGMRRARRKKGNYERIFKEYRSRTFKFASRNFYSEFLAAREAAKNYRQYFGDIKLNRPRKFHTFVLKNYVPLTELAEEFNINPAELQALNPALRRPVFRGQKYVPKGYHLRLPHRKGLDWNKIIAQLPRQIYRPKQKRSTIYTVRKGDTAGKIAQIHGVKLIDLIAVNNLNRRATIYVNQTLRIPLPEAKLGRVAKHTKNKPAAAVRQTKPKSRSAAAAGPAENRVAAAADSVAINVDGLPPKKPQAADAPGVSESAAGTNPAEPLVEFLLAQGAPAHYRPQETPAGSASQPQAPAVKQTDRNPALKPAIVQGHFAVERLSVEGGKPIGHIRVEAEETLGHYGEWLDVPVRKIRQMNGLKNGRPLQLSLRIKIPLVKVSKNEFEVRRFEYHQELAEDFFASYRVEKIWTYSIKKGDNIWTLSRQEFEVPLWLIKQYNGDVDFGALIPSQKLVVPVVEKDA
ncbi:Membrane-bound lytic murein transglycosylase D [Olavius algarvensis Delta 1 endosymbiont]|nr:Membrane-bound lytic murein transglycosylase D [Olavius algarvensis Delta 1 endosymbiont]